MTALIATSCATTSTGSGDVPAPVAEEQVVEESLEEDSEKVTLTGTVKSVAGVQNELSCYCANGAYMTIDGGEEVPVCFQKEVDVKQCVNPKITGVYVTVEIETDANNPCPSGAMTFFKVLDFTCD